MKSITILIHNIFHYGGTTKSISNLANILARKGHKVTILSVVSLNTHPYYPLEKNITIKTIFNYKELNIKNIIDVTINRINKYTSLFKPEILSKGDPNFKAFSSHIEKRLIKYLKADKSDVLISTRASYNIIVANLDIACIKIGMEHMFYEAHNHILQKDIKNSYQNLDLITVLSVQDKLVYKNLFPNTEVLYLPNILDEKRNNFNKENLILAAGRLEFEKGFDILIQAINELQEDIRKHNYLIKLFGDGSEKQKLLKMTENYNIRDIFEIHPSTNNLGAYLSASKITCVPSRVEGFGMVILEAMNQKSVVVSFDIGYGPSSLISNNINGLLASQGDYIDLSNKLKLLIQNDSYINSLSNSALDSISNYSPDNIYKILSYYIN